MFLSAFILKLIAVAAMLIDHIAVVFTPELSAVSPWLYTACRMIGRLAFPIFALGIAEGAVHTKAPKKYLARVFLFGIAAQLPFSLMAGLHDPSITLTVFGRTVALSTELSVMATLFLGLAVCLSLREKKPFGAALALIAAYAAELTIGMDYGLMGVLFIAALYLAREKKWMRFIVMTAFPVLFYFEPVVGMFSQLFASGTLTLTHGVLYFLCMAFAGVLVLFYNGSQGRRQGLGGYVFYPVHMLLLWLARFLLSWSGII